MTTVLKWVAILLLAVLLYHWFTAGHDEIIEGPPEIPGDSMCQQQCE